MSSPNRNIVLYDIATRPPLADTCCSPNPWKTRMALNVKDVPYSTSWVPLPDVEKIRRGLGLSACRTFADGTDFYTLPVLEDKAAGTLIGDSFDIAVHLNKTYPQSGAVDDLFPAQTLDFEFTHPWILVPLSEWRDKVFPDYARFNLNVDAVFTAHVQLTTMGFPFNPDTEAADRAQFIQRAGKESFDDFFLDDAARGKLKDEFRDALADLARLYRRDSSGPFLLGGRLSYADLAVGAWLRMFHVTLPESEWQELSSWHDAIFGKLHDALEVYREVK